MSTARLVVPGVSLRPGLLLVDRDYARHARVLRLRAGDAIILCDGAGHEMRGEIKDLKEDSLTVDLQEEVVREESTRRVSITLYQGIAKGERMEWIIQKATELGVDRIVPVAMTRSVAKYDKTPPRWEKIAQEAARQSERTQLPVIEPITSVLRHTGARSDSGIHLKTEMDPAVSKTRTGETVHPIRHTGARSDSGIHLKTEMGPAVATSWPTGETEGGRVKLLLDETGQGPRLREVLPPEASEVWVWVGPEGGVSPEERALIVGAGFIPVYLGQRILRTETAGMSIVAILQHHYGDLG
jgi:16S rRNA (uracil1498-N3)-methyltransferase